MKRKAAIPLMTIPKAATIIIEPEWGHSDMSFNKESFFGASASLQICIAQSKKNRPSNIARMSFRPDGLGTSIKIDLSDQKKR
jgi:hypothetical protein